MSNSSLPNVDEIGNQLPSLNNFPQSMLIIGSFNILNGHHSLTLINNQMSHQNEEQDSLGIMLERQIKRQQKQKVLEGLDISQKKKKGGCCCTKTACLKMYCQCFSSGKVCQESCSCSNCFNSQSFREEIVRSKEHVKRKNRSLNKCNCKKSHCDKKYCQCFNQGFKCSSLCKCTSCKNHHDATHQLDHHLQTDKQQHFNYHLLI